MKGVPSITTDEKGTRLDNVLVGIMEDEGKSYVLVQDGLFKEDVELYFEITNLSGHKIYSKINIKEACPKGKLSVASDDDKKIEIKGISGDP